MSYKINPTHEGNKGDYPENLSDIGGHKWSTKSKCEAECY